MSDEIEIEEHDLLDDPTVRNIFPDISRLKQEILDYDYVEAPDVENAVTTSSRSDSCDDTFRSTESSADREDAKIALPVDFKHNFQNDGPNNGFIRRDKGIEMKICNNKIIIGSKPIRSVDSEVEHFEKNVKPYCAVVVLEDFGIYLNSSTRYCQNCHILFPTNLDYNNHQENIHQELVDNIDRVDDDDKTVVRSEYSDEDKTIIQKSKEIEAKNTCSNEYEDVQQPTENLIKFSTSGETAICLICKAQLNHRKYISQHLMQVHKISKEKINEIMGTKKPSPRPTTTDVSSSLASVAKRNECFHCKKSFRSQHLLIEHIYSILQSPKNSSDKYANKILVGNKTNNSEQHNSLVPVNMDMPHKDIPNTNFEDCSTTEHVMKFFRCRFCLKYFKTTKIYFRHMKLIHKMVNNFQMTKVSFDPKCQYCPKMMDSVDSYNAHLHGYHRKKVLEAIEKSKRILFSINKGERNIVSKTTQNEFYRCDFCFSYFNNMKFLIRHVTIKHNVVRMPKPKKVAFDPNCKYCAGIYSNIKRYNVHLHKVHYDKCNQVVEKSTLMTSEERESNEVADANTGRKLIDTEEVYRCKFCPFYFRNTKWFLRHFINKHKIKDLPKMETETFNPKCYYCPKKSDNVTSYNDHLTKSHSALLNKVIVRSESANVTKKLKVHMKPKFPKLNTCNKSETGKDLIRQPRYELAYICKYCPTYFKIMRHYRRHVKVRHKLDIIPKQQMVKVDLKCKFCSATFTATRYYNKHIYKHHFIEIARKAILENKSTKPNVQTTKTAVNIENKSTKPNVQTTKTAVNMKEKKYYRCCYCSHYFNDIDVYDSHVKKKHKVLLPHDVKKIKFDAKCKYCPSETCSIKSYNVHLSKKHPNRVNEVFTGRLKNKINPGNTEVVKNTLLSSTSNTLLKMRETQKRDGNMANVSSNLTPILKSALFKCNKCDIHFLTIKTASDHVNHMELLVNWKCSLCNRIFKDDDKVLHEKQHLFSHVFTVYDLNTANASHILYKCSKCNLHYDESVDNHHEKCISEIPPSYTCEICKILIDCNSKICHEYNHKHRDLTSNDFIVLETDVIIDDNTGNIRPDKFNSQIVNNVIGSNQVEHNKQNKNTLKRKINNSKNSEVQIRPKKVKKTHGMFSKNESQDIVYNENYSNVITKNQQNFDKMLLKLSFCGTCRSFVSVIGHKRKEHMQGLCANLPTLICKDCGLRFSCKTLSTHRQVHLRVKNLQLQSFKFYNFHSGKRTMPPMPVYEKCGICKVNFISKSTLGHHVCSDSEYKLCGICNIKLFTPIFNLHMAFHKYNFDEASSNSTSNSAVVCDKKDKIQTPNKNILLILYRCKACNVHVDSYDRLIEHCRKHCLDTLPKYTEECKICKLKFDDSSLKTHGKVHEMLGTPTFDKLFFDPFYFRFENKVWLDHVFGSNPKIMVQDVILSSPYGNEHRFIMHVVQEGRFDLTLYKCDKCNMYVESDMIYHHIENSCSNLRKYPCPICHIDFISSFSLTRHKTTHEDPKVTLKSYRIVHFNRKEDADLNAVIFSPPKLYVLYQCRHCNGIVDNIHRTSHVCDKNNLKSCTDCELLITEDVYESHISKHETLDSFMAENMKVILFGEYELHEKKVNCIPTTNFRGKIHDYSFYKCRSCHVCLKHKNSTKSHCCHKGPRVSCSKCGLYFNADKLVSHTKTHETDPDFILDNMNIIDFNPAIHKTKDEELLEIGSSSNTKCEIETVDSSSNTKCEIETVDSSSNTKCEIETVDSSSNTKCEIETVDVNENANVNEASSESNVSQENSLVINTSEANAEIEKTADIYKCGCGLHFIDETSVLEHFTQCGTKAKQAKQNCSKCGLLFTPTILFKHLLSHHGNKLINYKFNIIDKSKT